MNTWRCEETAESHCFRGCYPGLELEAVSQHLEQQQGVKLGCCGCCSVRKVSDVFKALFLQNSAGIFFLFEKMLFLLLWV